MGARFIANTVLYSKGLKNIKTNEQDTEISFEFEAESGKSKTFTAYIPTRDDYEISVEVVDRAINLNCNLIIYDIWIFPTASGSDYANINGIPVYDVREFIKKIKNGKNLELL
jgi:hypothetical protein